MTGPPGVRCFAEAAYTIEDEPISKWKLKFAAFAGVYGNYFRAMGIPLLDGRYFSMNDRSDTPLVVIVNQTMAQHSWPGQRAIGKRMHVGNPHKGLPWATVVGVVADTKLGPRDEPSEDQWYFPGATTCHPLTAPEYQQGSPAIRRADTSPCVLLCLRST